MEPVTLHTDRLVLSAPAGADADAIFAACQDPEIPRWTTVPSPYTREHADDFIAQLAQQWADESHAIWGVFHDGELVGMMGLHHIAPNVGGGSAELGYWTTAHSRGQGFTVEAARAVIEWGFSERGLARITWLAVVGNIPSARTARALGFRYEGTLRQGLASPRGRDDGWMAGLLASDDRSPVEWSVPLD
jgi:RimJ/RimL family protein N-acetyltransferase